jgi:hypothetical protein
LTVSIQTVERSTVGTAGFNRESPMVARIIPSAMAEIVMIRRFRFFAAAPGRGMSMAERFEVKPVGRTIVFSVFLSGFVIWG